MQPRADARLSNPYLLYDLSSVQRQWILQGVRISLFDRRYPEEPLFCTDDGQGDDFVLNEDGAFIFGSVPPGAYTIHAVTPGHPERSVTEHATLDAGSDLHFDLVFE